jgi:hypothetical protein
VDVGRKQSQIGVAAPIEGKLRHLLQVNNLAVLARIRFENRRRSGHVDGLGNNAHLQGEIHSLAHVDIHDDIGGRRLGKALVLDSDRVTPHFDIEEIVVAALVGRGLGLNARVLIGKSNGGFGDSRVRIIPNRSQDFGSLKLRP